MVALRDIKGEALVQWAERIDASSTLPELVRRLLLASAPFQSISMPADSGVRLEGWDGVVNAAKAGPFWPAGPRSGSSRSTSGSGQSWTRTSTSAPRRRPPPLTRLGRPTSRSPRDVSDRRRRRSGSPRSDVWAPGPTCVSTTRMTSRPGWRWLLPWRAGSPLPSWSNPRRTSRTWKPSSAAGAIAASCGPLPSALAVAGRERQKSAELVRAWVAGPRPQPLHVRGETRDEALVFTAAALATARTEREQWLARALVVESREAWRWAVRVHQAQPLILLPGFEDFDPGEAVTSNAFVVVPEDASESRPPNVLLEPIPFKSFAEALVHAGVRAPDAERLAPGGGRQGVRLPDPGRPSSAIPCGPEEPRPTARHAPRRCVDAVERG